MINLFLGLDSSTYCFKFEDICERCEELGLNGIEIQLEHPSIWNNYPESVKNINDILESYEFKIAVHSPIKDLNMSSYNARIRELTFKELLIAEKFAENLNAEYFLIHAGKNSFVSQSLMSNWWKKKSIQHTITTISRLLKESNCKITMENMMWSEWRISSKKKFLVKIFESFSPESLYFTLDISHALERSRVFVYKLLELFGERLLSIHFGNYKIQNFIFDFLKKKKIELKHFNYLILEPHTLPLSSKKELLFPIISKNINLMKKELKKL
ncbi:MAG: sugar phosphate isomerase/epimerase family protein [Candidatus Helarchaeota archaeon]